MEHLILVDANDNQIGTAEKVQAHKDGALHRAFSIFVVNSKGEMLLQRRALSKYHCGGLWANTVCGHPRPGEKLEHAVHRRLNEELGFDCPLTKKFSYIYKAAFENGLTEHEFLHVFVGTSDAKPKPDPQEVMDVSWQSPDAVRRDLKKHPEQYAFWFHQSMERLKDDA